MNNFGKYFFANCRSARMQLLLIWSRSLTKGNCLYSSLSLLLIGDNSLVEVLRCLTSSELFLNPDYYGKHCGFDLAFNSQKDKIRHLHFFWLSLKSATLDHFSYDNIGAVKNEAILNSKDFEWNSFMRLLGLSSVMKGQILSYYPDTGDFNHKIHSIMTSLQELVILTKSASEYWFVAMKHLVLSSSLQNFSQIIFYHCYPQSRKEKKLIQATPVQLQKNFALSYQKWKVLLLDLIEVSNQK